MSSDQNEDIKPTWTYTPYQPPKPKRRFSDWVVPRQIHIPEDQLEINFLRSSGAGGQNVNKVNTKVELRFCLDDANWIPEEVRGRLKEQQASRINKDGILSVQAQEHRTQGQNRKEAMKKLQDIILLAYPRPKIRKKRKGPTKAEKERNKEFKRRRSLKKESRRSVDF